MNYPIHIDEDWSILEQIISDLKPSQIFILVDENTKAYCLPILLSSINIEHELLSIISGEENKNIHSATSIWSALIDEAADRNALIINLGGGVIGDMGGFCASTFKRGIRFIQIPTTLLAMVDASVGGKLGIDHLNYKNVIGSFSNPESVFIKSQFLQTLDKRILRSGFGEILKHAIIADKIHWSDIAHSHETEDYDWKALIEKSIAIKKNIVTEDPYEKGVRKVLNFGHTVGHAIESYFIETKDQLLHGEAVAIGIMIESKIALKSGMLSENESNEIFTLVSSFFPDLNLQYSPEDLIQIMLNDKKNLDGNILMALPTSIGSCTYDVKIEPTLIKEVLQSQFIT